jgi:protein-export membrane protein SecD
MLYFAKWKVAVVLLVSLAGLAFTAPNFVSRDTAQSLPDWLPHQQLALGLDLRGGSHLLLEVDIDKVIRERLEGVTDSVRTALRKERIGYTGLGARNDRVQVRIRKSEDFDTAVSLIRGLAQPVSQGFLSGGGGVDLEVTAGDDNFILVNLTEVALRSIVTSAITQSVEVIRRRVDEMGVAEATVQRQGSDRILVQVPGLDDPADLKRIIGQTAKLTFRMVDVNASVADALRGRVPPGSELLKTKKNDTGVGADQREAWVIKKKVLVSGEMLVDAQPGFDQRSNEPVVNFRFNQAGAKRFADATSKNVGRPFAIVLDNKVISAPVIREPILGGSGQISGNFTVDSANDLSVLLRAGALPADIKIIEERTVGPDLGADSIEAGKIAAILGFVLVIVFMVAAYGLFGVAANAALIVNMLLIFGGLSILQATLTLPGIAGIVLTIGMAVDANVLIFERIKEEIASGKTPFNAVEAGYKRAFTTIIDANVTTAIAALILFALGSGPVKGFAVTLGIGIVSSMFTAILLTRLLISTYLRRRRPAALAL